MPDPVPWIVAPSGRLSANTLPGGVFVCPGRSALCGVTEGMLGWTSVDGRPFQVRQFRNRKGSVDPAALAADQIDDYARMTGALLARAHTAAPRLIAGYCGKSEELDKAIASFAVTYADRTEADHNELVAAVRYGRIAAEPGVRREGPAGHGRAEHMRGLGPGGGGEPRWAVGPWPTLVG